MPLNVCVVAVVVVVVVVSDVVDVESVSVADVGRLNLGSVHATVNMTIAATRGRRWRERLKLDR
jgi:hypothetical protein